MLGRARRALRTAMALVCLISVLSACSQSTPLNDPGIPGSGGFLRIGSIAVVNSLNPWITDDQLSLDLQSDMYPKLLQYNLKTLAFEPAFASSWRRTDNGRTLVFTTRADAEWSDGRALTARDVAWTIGTMVRLRKGAGALWASAVAGVQSVTAPNATTVDITYKQETADALANLEQIPILPEHVWATYAIGAGKALHTVPNTPSSGHPVVSGGPFTFVKYTYDQVIVLERNPHYWGTPAHIAGFGIELFSNDDALVAAMRAGEVDAAFGDPTIPPTDVRPLRDSGERILKVPAVSYNDLILNTNPRKTGHRELLDPNVRKAFEYATDRNTIDRIAYLGYAQPGSSIVPPSTGAWYDPKVRPLPYDPAEANRLLDAAGFRRGSNGIRIADGHPMAYTVYLSQDNGGEGIRSGSILTSDFAKIGVRLTVEQTDDDAMNDDVTADHYRRYDLAMWGWDTFIDPTYILDAMTCLQWYDNSDSGYCNKTYDRLYREQEITMDPVKRRAIVYRMQEIIANARPYIVLQYVDVLEAWNPRWSNVQLSPDGWLSQFSSDPQTEITAASSTG